MEFRRKKFPDKKAPLAELRFLANGVDIFVLTDDPHVILKALKRQFVQCHADLADYPKMVAGIIHTGLITFLSMQVLERIRQRGLF